VAESDEEEDVESEEEVKKPAAKRGRKAAPAKNGSDSGSEEEAAPKKRGRKPAAAKPKAAAGARKAGTGITKECKLSPELAALMGQPMMARQAVVKRMWQIVKERNLADPDDKKFTICDAQLQKVFGVKRFQTFGMLKYLKTHFLD